MICPACGKWAANEPRWRFGCGPRCHPTLWFCRHCSTTFVDPADVAVLAADAEARAPS